MITREQFVLKNCVVRMISATFLTGINLKLSTSPSDIYQTTKGEQGTDRKKQTTVKLKEMKGLPSLLGMKSFGSFRS